MASRFWVGGTGTWDGSDTTHWAATTGGAGGQSVPGSSDTVTFDGNSGGGTVTVNTNANIISITMGAFNGTLDFSVNNNTITFVSSASQIFSVTGIGTRTLKTGTANFVFSGPTGFNTWDFTNVTSLTANTGSEATTVNVRSAAGSFIGNSAVTMGTIILNTSGNGFPFAITGTLNAGTLTINGPYITLASGVTHTITNLNLTGTSTAPCYITSNANTTATTITATSVSATYGIFREITFTNATVANSSFSLGSNTNLTANAPASGSKMIGS